MSRQTLTDIIREALIGKKVRLYKVGIKTSTKRFL